MLIKQCVMCETTLFSEANAVMYDVYYICMYTINLWWAKSSGRTYEEGLLSGFARRSSRGLLSSPSSRLRRAKSGRLDAIRTSFQSLSNPAELENQFDQLSELCLQNEVINETDRKASEILPTDKIDSQPNLAEILYHTKGY